MSYSEFDLAEWRRSRQTQTCICQHFGPPPMYEAKAPYNASCYFHGARRTGPGEYGDEKEQTLA